MSQPLPYGRGAVLDAAIARKPRIVLWLLYWFLCLLPLLAACIGAIALLNTAYRNAISAIYLTNFGGYAIIAGAILLLTLVGAQGNSRRRRARLVLSHLEFAVDANLPLLTLLYAAEQTEHGFTRTRLRTLRHRLAEGLPLQGALSLAVPELSIRDLARIGSAERNGTLPTELARLAESPTDSSNEPNVRASLLSLCGVVLFFTLVAGVLIGTFLLPRFGTKSFGVPGGDFAELRRLLQATWLLQVLAFPVALLTLYILLVAGITRAFRIPRRRAPLIWLRDHVMHRIPVVSGFIRDRAMTDGLRTMSQGVAAGRTLPQAVGEAAQAHLNLVWQERFDRFATQLIYGVELGPAARAAKMPRLVAEALTQSHGTGLAPTFAWLSEFYSARDTRRRAILRSVVPLIATLVAGLLVYSLSTAMFGDMARLNEAALRRVEIHR